MDDLDFNPDTMYLASCRTCWDNGFKKTARYRSNRKCVRCKLAQNKVSYEIKKTQGGVNA